jgi:hypothetical protein
MKPTNSLPAPVAEAPHARDLLPADVACEHGPILFHQCRRISWQIYTALEEQLFKVPQRERKVHIHHHNEADHLG